MHINIILWTFCTIYLVIRYWRPQTIVSIRLTEQLNLCMFCPTNVDLELTHDTVQVVNRAHCKAMFRLATQIILCPWITDFSMNQQPQTIEQNIRASYYFQSINSHIALLRCADGLRGRSPHSVCSGYTQYDITCYNIFLYPLVQKHPYLYGAVMITVAVSSSLSVHQSNYIDIKEMIEMEIYTRSMVSVAMRLHTRYKSSFCAVNTLRPRQIGRHFADDIFKCIFFIENVWIQIRISLKFDPKGPINNIPALV